MEMKSKVIETNKQYLCMYNILITHNNGRVEKK